MKPAKERNRERFIVVFFLANLLLSTYFIDLWNGPNPVSRALPVVTFSESETLQIDRYADRVEDKSKVGEHFYSDKAPLPTFAVIPFYEALKAVGIQKIGENACDRFPIYVWRPLGVEDGRQILFREIIPVLWLGSFLCGSLPFALIIVFSFLSVQRKRLPLSPVLLVMLAFYGSFLFVYSGTYFNHIFSGFLLLVGYIFLKGKRFLLSGLFVGLGFLSEYTVGLFVPLWAFLIWRALSAFSSTTMSSRAPLSEC